MRLYGDIQKRSKATRMQSECIPEFIFSRPVVISVAYTLKMAASNDGNNICTFMEEIQKYDCIYNKYSRDYKNKFIRINCFQKIGEKFRISAEEVEKKYRPTRTGYGRWLKRRKNIPVPECEKRPILLVSGIFCAPRIYAFFLTALHELFYGAKSQKTEYNVRAIPFDFLPPFRFNL